MAESKSNDDCIEVFMQISPQMLEKLEYLSDELDREVSSVVALGINLLGVVTEEREDGLYLGFSKDKDKLETMIEVLGDAEDT